jgi:hypothetical protein
MGGLDGPPNPPALGDAPGHPGRPSITRESAGLDGPPPNPPALGDAPGHPGRPSITRESAGLDGPPQMIGGGVMLSFAVR